MPDDVEVRTVWDRIQTNMKQAQRACIYVENCSHPAYSRITVWNSLINKHLICRLFTDIIVSLIHTEDEEPEATALIPLMEECENALLDKTFQKFIYTIGINPPTDEQV